MALTIALNEATEQQNGYRKATFAVTWDSDYDTSGKTADVSTWFSGSPKLVGAAPEANGYIAVHDGGTAAAGVLTLAYAFASSTQPGIPADSTDVSNITTYVTFVGTAA